MKIMEYQAFGDWLRHRRLKLDISPFKMAEALGYKRVSAIYNFEYGVAPLPMSKWPAMARVLELSLEEFLSVMQRYAPQKVTEFRNIQSTGMVPPKEFRPVPNGLPVRNLPAESTGEGFRDYHLERAETAVVLAGPVDREVLRFFDGLAKEDTAVGLIEVLGGEFFPGTTLVDRLKEVSQIGILTGEKEAGLEAYLKAAFLDALTGTAGFPHIHRVPKFYTGLLEEGPGSVDLENIRTFLGMIEKAPDTRRVRIAGRSEMKA
jgi:hypothetical protein